MKRRILSTFLMLCLLLTSVAVLASCGRVEKTLEKAMEKTSALDEYEVDIHQVSTMDMDGEQVKVIVNTNMKVKDAKSETPTILMEMEVQVGSRKQTAVTYLEGTWMYVVNGSSGYKINIQEKEETAEEYLGQVDSVVKMLPEDTMKDAKVDREDGKKIITATIEGKLMDDVYEELVNKVLEDSGLDDATLSQVSLSFDDAEVEIVIKDDYILSYEVDYDMDMTVMGESMTSSNSVKLKYLDPGSSVHITPPEGYRNFKEMRY